MAIQSALKTPRAPKAAAVRRRDIFVQLRREIVSGRLVPGQPDALIIEADNLVETAGAGATLMLSGVVCSATILSLDLGPSGQAVPIGFLSFDTSPTTYGAITVSATGADGFFTRGSGAPGTVTFSDTASPATDSVPAGRSASKIRSP